MFEFSKEAEKLLASLPLHSAEPIRRLLSSHLAPLHRMLASVGVENPAGLSLSLG
jgi:hypothetical protein